MAANSIDNLISKIKAYNPNCDEEKIMAAYDLAKSAHGEQKRISGTPYITHPLAVADIVAIPLLSLIVPFSL